MSEQRAAANTDRELWREREGDYYASSIHVTVRGGIGINVGGRVFVKSLAEWHALATRALAERDAVAFQGRVQSWMMECFGLKISRDKVERADRLLEEVFELLQSGGYDPARIVTLARYVWSRPVGEPDQETGGVMVTLAAYCLAFGLDMHAAGERELARISTPETVAKIRAKQAAKAAIDMGSPLPDAAAIRLTARAGEVGE